MIIFFYRIKNELPWDFLKMTENIVLTKEVLHLCRRWISILKCISSQFFFPLSWCLSISIKWFWTSFSQKVIYLFFFVTTDSYKILVLHDISILLILSGTKNHLKSLLKQIPFLNSHGSGVLGRGLNLHLLQIHQLILK